MRITTLAAVTLAAAALSACQRSYGTTSIQEHYNRGENVIRAHIGAGACLDCFNAYRGWSDEKAFALSASGTFAYARGRNTQGEANRQALETCQSYNRQDEANKPCQLLMSGHRFVWR